MADRVRKVSYTYVKVPSRPGQGAGILAALKKAGVDLLAYSGFPAGGGKAQIDIVTKDLSAVTKVARKEGWRLSKAKKGFLVQGEDKVGAVEKHLLRMGPRNTRLLQAKARDIRQALGLPPPAAGR